MVENFEPLQQPLGSNSCVPTAVRAILAYFDITVSPEVASNWCREERDGCRLDDAMQGLRNAGFDVLEISSEAELRNLVNDEEDPLPILVNIEPPFGAPDIYHVVVLLGITAASNGEQQVLFMDPLSGSIKSEEYYTFWRMWDFGGCLAFVIDPR